VTVVDEFVLLGAIEGAVTVESGGNLQILGEVERDLTVKPGGIAAVLGLVGGDVVNMGGELTVAGKVAGRLRAEAGRTRVDEKSKIVGGVSGAVERVKIVTP